MGSADQAARAVVAVSCWAACTGAGTATHPILVRYADTPDQKLRSSLFYLSKSLACQPLKVLNLLLILMVSSPGICWTETRACMHWKALKHHDRAGTCSAPGTIM